MSNTIKVWDPLVRVFHWSLAGLFFANFFTEGGETLHIWFGYTILGLLATRFVWGWIGTRHARFSDWVRGPRATRTYLRARLAGRSRRQLGHNPGAAMMILALLSGVLATGITGWLQTTDRFFGVMWMESLHEVLAWSVLVLVGAHVLAAVGESFHYGENLIASMIHGHKRPLDEREVGGD